MWFQCLHAQQLGLALRKKRTGSAQLFFSSFRMAVFVRWTQVSSVRGLWVAARPPVVSAQRTQHYLEFFSVKQLVVFAIDGPGW
jgi:hypothetical protein